MTEYIAVISKENFIEGLPMINKTLSVYFDTTSKSVMCILTKKDKRDWEKKCKKAGINASVYIKELTKEDKEKLEKLHNVKKEEEVKVDLISEGEEMRNEINEIINDPEFQKAALKAQNDESKK